MIALLNSLQDRIDALPAVDFLAPLALRLYLASVFWVAGMNKVADFENTVAWFDNPDWGLGLPLPTLMAALAPHGDRQRGFPDSDCERFRRDAFALDFKPMPAAAAGPVVGSTRSLAHAATLNCDQE
jgi:uncharacterized membrane protein YphA (DoxX/SURF4 family)